MFAILELGGKQYLVREKQILRVEKLATEPSKTFACEKVLLTSDEESAKVGTPYLPGAQVALKVLSIGKDDKVRTFKMKAKKRYKRLKGHRQAFTDVEVTKIHA